MYDFRYKDVEMLVVKVRDIKMSQYVGYYNSNEQKCLKMLAVKAN